MPELNFPERYPEFLQHVAIAVHDYLLSNKVLPHQEAAQAAFGAAERVRQQTGGGRAYIAKGTFYEADLRAQEIYERFNGRNGPQLAREYNLTEERIRQICSERMLAERAARQGQLPGL
jgi:Mor family transcriptional regulator